MGPSGATGYSSVAFCETCRVIYLLPVWDSSEAAQKKPLRQKPQKVNKSKSEIIEHFSLAFPQLDIKTCKRRQAA